MTEYNIFCYSKIYNDKNSLQQKKYKVFNQEVDEKRFNVLKVLINNILSNPNKLQLATYWKSITSKQWEDLLAIPEAKDFKEGFEYISNQKIVLEDALVGTEVSVTIGNKTYCAVITK